MNSCGTAVLAEELDCQGDVLHHSALPWLCSGWYSPSCWNHSIFTSIHPQRVSPSLDCTWTPSHEANTTWKLTVWNWKNPACSMSLLGHALEDQSVLEAKKEMDPHLQRTVEWWIRDLELLSGCRCILFLSYCFFYFFISLLQWVAFVSNTSILKREPICVSGQSLTCMSLQNL